MIIAVASGKGGTGKTTIAVNLALSLDCVQLLDCDVEEPNAHIFLKPEIRETQTVNIPVPRVDESKCNYCSKCAKVCAYNAIAVIKQKVLIFPEMCHGCGGCTLLCPQEAISEVNKEIGVVELGQSNGVQFVHGRLNIGQAMSPPLIRAVKRNINPTRLCIIDAPPGTSCPVIEAVKETDFCLLVTEPTPFGLCDLELAVEAIRLLKIPFGVVINRADIGDEGVREYCLRENIPILMEIPMDRRIAEAYSIGVPMVKSLPEWKERFRELYSSISGVSEDVMGVNSII
ncbi:MAG: ATP-binding protein [bacterium]